jgi:hypothetical protein
MENRPFLLITKFSFCVKLRFLWMCHEQSCEDIFSVSTEETIFVRRGLVVGEYTCKGRLLQRDRRIDSRY